MADEGIGPNFFDALHESAYGTKRTSRCKLAYVRFWGEADVRCRLALMACAAFDPKRT